MALRALVLLEYRQILKTEEQAIESWKNNDKWLLVEEGGVREITREFLLREQGCNVFVQLRYCDRNKIVKITI